MFLFPMSLGLWDVVLLPLTSLLYAVTTFSQAHHVLGMMLTFPRGPPITTGTWLRFSSLNTSEKFPS